MKVEAAADQNGRVRLEAASRARADDKAYMAVHYLALGAPRPRGAQQMARLPADTVTIQCADNVRCSYTSNERKGGLWKRYKHAEPVLRILRQARTVKSALSNSPAEINK